MNLVGQPWNVVFFVGFVVYVVIRGRFMSRTKANENAVSRVDGVEKVLIAVVSIGTMVLPLVYLFTTWLGFADYVLPASAPWIGTGVMIAALWLFWRSHATRSDGSPAWVSREPTDLAMSSITPTAAMVGVGRMGRPSVSL